MSRGEGRKYYSYSSKFILKDYTESKKKNQKKLEMALMSSYKNEKVKISIEENYLQSKSRFNKEELVWLTSQFLKGSEHTNEDGRIDYKIVGTFSYFPK